MAAMDERPGRPVVVAVVVGLAQLAQLLLAPIIQTAVRAYRPQLQDQASHAVVVVAAVLINAVIPAPVGPEDRVVAVVPARVVAPQQPDRPILVVVVAAAESRRVQL